MTSNWYSGSVSTLTLSLARWSRSARGQQSRPTMIQGLSRIAQPLLMNADENILDEARLDGVGIAPHRGVIREVAGAPCLGVVGDGLDHRSEEHTSALQSLMRISYAVFCLK